MTHTFVRAWPRLAIVCGGAIAALSGCGNDPNGSTASGALGRDSWPLFNATDSTAGPDDGVLLLRATAQGEALCTATLVAPNLIITTRHCVAFTGPPGFLCTPEGELVPDADGRGTLGAHIPADTIAFHSGLIPSAEPVARGTRVLSSLSETMCKNDIAYVVLDRALDLPIHPIRLGKKTSAGELMTFVGYGLDENRIADYRKRPRKRAEHQRLLAVGPDSVQQGVIDAPPRVLVFEGPSSCLGDSGGPAISEDTSAVTGVFSLLEGDLCSKPGIRVFYTHVAPFESLAREAFEAASATAWLEGEPDPRLAPAGASCSDGTSCQSGVCTASVCAQRCKANAECAAGLVCQTSAANPVCVPTKSSEGSGSCAVARHQHRTASTALALLGVACWLYSRRRQA